MFAGLSELEHTGYTFAMKRTLTVFLCQSNRKESARETDIGRQNGIQALG